MIEREIESQILYENGPDGARVPARAEIQAVFARHGDWENFAPPQVRFRLRLEKNALVREGLRQVLERRLYYWRGRVDSAAQTQLNKAASGEPVSPAKVVMNGSYDPIWSLSGDTNGLEMRRERFNRLARRAVVALGERFVVPAEAVDAWLNRLHKFHWGRKTRFGKADWNIILLADAAAEYCAELNTRFHEACNADAERTFIDLEQQFHELSNPNVEFYAIRRRDTALRRKRYPFDNRLYDHPHEPLPSVGNELAYWRASQGVRVKMNPSRGSESPEEVPFSLLAAWAGRQQCCPSANSRKRDIHFRPPQKN